MAVSSWSTTANASLLCAYVDDVLSADYAVKIMSEARAGARRSPGCGK